MWAARTLFRADVGSAHIISREGRVRVGFYARNYRCRNAQRGAIFRAVHQCGKDNVRTRKCALQQCGVGHADSAVNRVRWLPCRASHVNLKQCKQITLRKQSSVVSPSLHRAMKVCKQSIWRNNRLEFHCMDSLVAVVKVLLTYGWPAYRTDSPVDKTPHT